MNKVLNHFNGFGLPTEKSVWCIVPEDEEATEETIIMEWGECVMVLGMFTKENIQAMDMCGNLAFWENDNPSYFRLFEGIEKRLCLIFVFAKRT